MAALEALGHELPTDLGQGAALEVRPEAALREDLFRQRPGQGVLPVLPDRKEVPADPLLDPAGDRHLHEDVPHHVAQRIGALPRAGQDDRVGERPGGHPSQGEAGEVVLEPLLDEVVQPVDETAPFPDLQAVEAQRSHGAQPDGSVRIGEDLLEHVAAPDLVLQQLDRPLGRRLPLRTVGPQKAMEADRHRGGLDLVVGSPSRMEPHHPLWDPPVEDVDRGRAVDPVGLHGALPGIDESLPCRRNPKLRGLD